LPLFKAKNKKHEEVEEVNKRNEIVIEELFEKVQLFAVSAAKEDKLIISRDYPERLQLKYNF
jgi:hypothetical protein